MHRLPGCALQRLLLGQRNTWREQSSTCSQQFVAEEDFPKDELHCMHQDLAYRHAQRAWEIGNGLQTQFWSAQ